LLLATDNEGRTVFHVAAGISDLGVFPRILNCAKEILTRQEVNKMFLGTDNEGRMVFHMAAKISGAGILPTILNCAK
jgi:hypothetical protein